jgi:hypothetical protein
VSRAELDGPYREGRRDSDDRDPGDGQEDLMELAGATIVVTGASSGIGRETAMRLASQGANVVIAARREAPLRDVEREADALGAQVLVVAVDVTDEAAMTALGEAAIERFGRIDGWKARYRWVGASSARQPVVLESRADLFDSDGGAKKDLDAYRKELESPPAGSGIRVTELRAPKLGDETIAFRSTQASLVFVTVAWRRANATASLLAEGFSGRLEPQGVYRLARRQAKRLD